MASGSDRLHLRSCHATAEMVVGWHQALIGYTWWEGVLLVVVVVGWHQALIGYTSYAETS